MWSRGQASGLESHGTGEEGAVVARGEEQGGAQAGCGEVGAVGSSRMVLLRRSNREGARLERLESRRGKRGVRTEAGRIFPMQYY